jgi:starch phosphorylase
MNDTGRGGSTPRTLFTLEARPRLPEPLRRLEELAGNLAYAWDRRIRAVFPALDAEAWHASGKNPRLFLRRLPQAVLDRAARNEQFLALYRHAIESLDALQAAPRSPALDGHIAADDVIAYFCAEFGVHETLPIYSGGLGVLAGDHCKAASDLGLPLVAVGLLYRQGYFTQTLDAHGRQHAHAHASDFESLPVALCRDGAGHEQRVSVEVAERQVQLRLWQAHIGRIPLVLLDADVPENEPGERAITHQLYGGDADTRIRQELVLGIGGLRALRALGYRPTVFHFNEGHAAFVILERLREQVAAGLDFAGALEAVAASHVFTTHTPVAAGHDVFTHNQVRWHLRALLPQLGAPEERVLGLGTIEPVTDPHHGRFNMTTLALRGSRFHNGVSRIHGRVARRMERALWPQVRTADVPIRHVTNGVHLHTFLAGAWARRFDEHLPGWNERLLDTAFWTGVDRIPDEAFVATRRELKHELLADVAQRLRHQLERNGVPASIATRVLREVARGEGDPLVLGFARRFATYKRATLVLGDPARLARLLGDPARPALLIFAGKAHPRDQPAQALIQQIWEASLRPELVGRLLVVEGYDLRLARHLVQGCDVWINNPEYPLEACGTSGQKAGLNGAVNVSVLDGWWDEGHVAHGPGGPNGFAVRPADLRFWDPLHADDKARHERDLEEGRQLFDVLEREVVPRYFGGAGGAPYGPDWIRIARNAMRTLIPRYNSARMVIDYVRDFYGPAAKHGRRRAAEGAAEARAFAAWKQHVLAAWAGVRLSLPEAPRLSVEQGERVPLRVLAQLNGLAPGDVAVECELGRRDGGGAFVRQRVQRLRPAEAAGGEQAFAGELEPGAGLQQFRIRMRPDHAALCHPFELGLVVWL